MIEQEFETPGTALLHYGVAGMKWGKSRAGGSTAQVKGARSRDISRSQDIRKADHKASRIADAGQRSVANMEVKKMKTARFKNPDRVLSTRLTIGEKAAVALLFTPPIALVTIGATSAQSRRIERKQELNKY